MMENVFFKESDRNKIGNIEFIEKMSSTKKNKVKILFMLDDDFKNNETLKIYGQYGMTKDGFEFYVIPSYYVVPFYKL